MSLVEIHYQRYDDRKRVKRGAEGVRRTFTPAEARRFLARNRHRYPRARFVEVDSSPATRAADTRKKKGTR